MLSHPARGRVVHVSLSEVDSVVQKAARGVGLPLGYGEDAGRLARRMAEFGVDGTRSVADALEALDAGRTQGLDVERALTGHFASAQPDTAVSALWVAPGVRDWLLVGAKRGARPVQAEIRAVDAPLIILFSCLEASANLDGDLCLSRIGADGEVLQAHCCRGALFGQYDILADLAQPGAWDLRTAIREGRDVASLEPIPADGSTRENGLDVEEAVWRRLTRLAERCLVEGTEASRRSGAGAGLIDTD